MANEVTVPLLPCARRAGDDAHAEAALAELRAIPLTDDERTVVADTLAAIDDLA